MTKRTEYVDSDFPLQSAPAPPTWGIDEAELANLWHLSRVALARSGVQASEYERRLWASKAYHDAHPETSSTAAYKVLDRSPWT